MEDEAEFLLSYVAEINEQHNITATVQEAGYYTDASQFTTDADDLGFLSALNDNGSDEFFRIYSELFAQSKMNYSLDEIIDNGRLLPNEQIALTVAIAWVSDEAVTRGIPDSGTAARLGYCKSQSILGFLRAAIIAPFNRKVALTELVFTLADETECIFS